MNETIIKSFAYLAFAKDLKKQGNPFCHEHFMKIQKLILTNLGKALLKFLKHFLKSKYFGSFAANEGRVEQVEVKVSDKNERKDKMSHLLYYFTETSKTPTNKMFASHSV